MVGPSPEAALLRGLRPQCHYVGHRRPQRTNTALAGASVSYRVLLHSGMDPSLLSFCFLSKMWELQSEFAKWDVDI